MPCGECTACCTAAQFVHVCPDEHETLAVIPPELLFPAPGFPPGHVLMGYDERGRCPMLEDNRCSVYAHRPRTCRTYDCRVFAATDVGPDDATIAARVSEWRFAYPTPDDEQARAELVARAAADNDPNPTRRAVRAINAGD